MVKPLAVLSLLLVGLVARGADPAPIPELGKMPNGKTASKEWADKGWAMAGQIPELLATDGPAEGTKPSDRQKAVQIAKILLKARPTFFTGTKNDGVIKFLYAKKMFAELVDLADFGIFAHPESTVDVAIVQRYKVLCLTELGKHDQAIAAAKSYYNVCKLASTNDAIQLLATTLTKADSKNAELVVQLRQQHAEGMKVGVDPEKLRIPLTRSASIDSIKVDASLYAAAIEKTNGADVLALVARGNLLLLADRASEAQAAFDDAYPQVDAKNAAAAAEDVARAMRASDGALARANAWLETPWPVGAIGDPRLAEIATNKSMIVPQQPLPHVLAKRISAPLALVAWLTKWEADVAAMSQASSEEVVTLEKLLAVSNLSVDQLLQLMKSTQSLDDGAPNPRQRQYPDVSGVVACQIVYTGAREVANDPKRRDIALSKIASLVQRLWLGPSRHCVALEAFYVSLANDQEPGSLDWIRGKLAHAEVIGLQGRADEAVKLLDELTAALPSMDGALKAKINWDKGLILVKAGRNADAIAPLQIAAHSDARKDNRGDARAHLVIALSRAGKLSEAQREYEKLRVSTDESGYAQQAFLIMRACIRSEALTGNK